MSSRRLFTTGFASSVLLAACGLNVVGAQGDPAPIDPAALDSGIGAVDGVAPANTDTSTSTTDGPATPTGPVLTGWPLRRKLTLATGNIANLPSVAKQPIYVRLDADRITYANMRANGEDLRFTDANGNLLPHEIERWTTTPNTSSSVWVAVTIAPTALMEIWMHYGNPDAKAPDPNVATQVWDADFIGVWHLADAHDSTGKHTSTATATTPALHGANPALYFNGTSAIVDTGSTEQLTQFTIETWIHAETASVSAVSATQPLSRGTNYQIQWRCTNEIFCRSANLSTAGTFKPTSFGATLMPAVWYQLLATYDGTNLVTYVNGVLAATTNIPGPPTIDVVSASIGRGSIGTPTTGTFYQGDLDEVRISRVVRSVDYAMLTNRSMIETLITFGPEVK